MTSAHVYNTKSRITELWMRILNHVIRMNTHKTNSRSELAKRIK